MGWGTISNASAPLPLPPLRSQLPLLPRILCCSHATPRPEGGPSPHLWAIAQAVLLAWTALSLLRSPLWASSPSFRPSSRKKSHGCLHPSITAGTAPYFSYWCASPSPPLDHKLGEKEGTVGSHLCTHSWQTTGTKSTQEVFTGSELSRCAYTAPICDSFSDLEFRPVFPKEKKWVLDLRDIFQHFNFIVFKNFFVSEKNYKIHCIKFIQRNDFSPVVPKKYLLREILFWEAVNNFTICNRSRHTNNYNVDTSFVK